MRTTCPNCGERRLRKGTVHEELFGVDLGTYEGEICGACGETFLAESAVRRVEQRARALGLWGLASKIRVVKSGNSMVVRIPAPLVRHLKLKVGQELTISPERHNRLVLELA